MNIAEWHAEGVRLWGSDVNRWLFTCPACGHIQSRQDFLDLGLPVLQVDWYLGYTCIGHFRQTSPKLPISEVFEMDQGYGCKYQGGLEPNVSPVLLETGPNEVRPTFGFTPCETYGDDRVVCAHCDQRPINCRCNPQAWRDCDGCLSRRHPR